MAIDRTKKYIFEYQLSNGWTKRMTIYGYGNAATLTAVNDFTNESINSDTYELFEREEPTVGFMNVASWTIEFDTSRIDSNLYAMLYNPSDWCYEDWYADFLFVTTGYELNNYIDLKVKRSNILIVEFDYNDGNGFVLEWIGVQQDINNYEFDKSTPAIEVVFQDFNVMLNEITTSLLSQIWKVSDANLVWFSSTENSLTSKNGFAHYIESSFFYGIGVGTSYIPTTFITKPETYYEYVFIRLDSINTYLQKLQDKIRSLWIREPLAHGVSGYHEFAYPQKIYKQVYDNTGELGAEIGAPYVLAFIGKKQGAAFDLNNRWFWQRDSFGGLNYDSSNLIGGLLYEASGKSSYNAGLAVYEDKNLYQVLNEVYQQYFRKSYVSPVGGFNYRLYYAVTNYVDITDHVLQFSENIKINNNDIISENFFDLVDKVDDDLDTVGAVNIQTYKSTVAENEYTLQSVFHAEPSTPTFLVDNGEEGKEHDNCYFVHKRFEDWLFKDDVNKTYIAIKNGNEHLFSYFYREDYSNLPIKPKFEISEVAVKCHNWLDYNLSNTVRVSEIAYAATPTVPINSFVPVQDYSFDSGDDYDRMKKNPNPIRKQSATGAIGVGANTMAALFGSRQNLTVEIEGVEITESFLSLITFLDLEDEISGTYDKITNLLMYPIRPFRLDLRKITGDSQFEEPYYFFQVRSVVISWHNDKIEADISLIGINNKITNVVI